MAAATAWIAGGAMVPPQSMVCPVVLPTKPGCGPERPTQNAANVWRAAGAGAGALTGATGATGAMLICADRTTGAGVTGRCTMRGGVVVDATVRIGVPTLRAGRGAGAGAWATTGAGAAAVNVG